MTIEELVRTARTADSTGRVEQAVFLCNQALDLDPTCVEALLILGSVAARHGKVAEAEEILREAISIDPDSYDALRWLTTLLIGRNGGGDAVEFGRRAVALRPNLAENHVILGMAALGHGDVGLAITSLERAVEIDPRLSAAYHNLGVAYQRDENFDAAIQAFRRAIALSPSVVESHLHLARCCLAKDQGDEALECAHRVLELRPDSRDGKQLLADATYVAVHGDNGLEHIEAAIAHNPESHFPYALMGSRLQEQGDFVGAEDSIQRSIALQPDQGFAYYLLAHNRKIRADDRPIIEQIGAISRKSCLGIEDRQYIHFGLGKAYDDLGEFERAIHHFDLAHEQDDVEDVYRNGQPQNWYTLRAKRWTQLLTKEVLDRFSHLGMESQEPIFIFGMPRSGTTLLEQIVSRHSRVGAAGELFYWRDSCHRIVNLQKGALNSKEVSKVGQKYLEQIRSISPGKAHVTDKFPSNYVYLGLLHLVFPRAIFLHARRHPLDTSLSIYMRPFSTNQGLGRTRQEIVETYRSYRASIDSWRDTLAPNRFFDVDYEQMVQDPEGMTRKVIQFCGLAWEDACLRPQEGDRRVITFSKWQVRQPVYTTSVERWRNYEPWLGIFRELLEYA